MFCISSYRPIISSTRCGEYLPQELAHILLCPCWSHVPISQSPCDCADGPRQVWPLVIHSISGEVCWWERVPGQGGASLKIDQTLWEVSFLNMYYFFIVGRKYCWDSLKQYKLPELDWYRLGMTWRVTALEKWVHLKCVHINIYRFSYHSSKFLCLSVTSLI